MAKDFEQIGHKNLELLRFYVTKDIKQIDEKLQENESDLLGYFLGSLIDILIVLLFDDGFNIMISLYTSCIFLQMVFKILLIFLLIILFILVSWITKKVKNFKLKKLRVSGKSAYVIKSEHQDMIDDFDNVACDGLLICKNYMYRYDKVNEMYLKEFYLYEIIHHLCKSSDIFNEIYDHQTLYISDSNNQLLDSYRINNFIVFARNIVEFLESEYGKSFSNKELEKDMINLKEMVYGWQLIEEK